MRLAVEAHDVTDTDGDCDLVNHMHAVHHTHRRALRDATLEELDLMHADDHDDMRRGIGSSAGLAEGMPSVGKTLDPTLTDEELAAMANLAAYAREHVEAQRVDHNIHPNVLAADLDVLLPLQHRLIDALRASREEAKQLRWKLSDSDRWAAPGRDA